MTVTELEAPLTRSEALRTWTPAKMPYASLVPADLRANLAFRAKARTEGRKSQRAAHDLWVMSRGRGGLHLAHHVSP